ncbi:MAG: hypothetical protein GY943_27575 [Chloroflexi bacterium]|nr:hypothetical protein [Chloroflexota bacterium]
MEPIDSNDATVSAAEAAEKLGNGVSLEDVYGRIRRGTLSASKDEWGNWRIPIANLTQILNDIEDCGSCSNLATSYVIVKYHHHNRVEFTLCDDCAKKAHVAYGRRGGVLEIITYPLLSEGWRKP